MVGTREGALKAKKTRIERYGKDVFSRMGKKGGNPVLLAQRDDKMRKASSAELA